MRVLIVEDEQEVAGVLHDFLMALGHDPDLAPSAEAALQQIQSDPPDLVMLDLYLPGMNGLEFLDLHAQRRVAIPIVAISGVATESQARDSLQRGAVDFIGKPMALERVAQVIDSLAPGPSVKRRAARQMDRRGAPRVPVEVPVRVQEYTGSEWTATSVNISTTGIKIRSEYPVRPGLAVKLRIALPDRTDDLEIRSLLSRADVDGYAFRFARLSDEQQTCLSAFVERHVTAGSATAAPHLPILQSISQALDQSPGLDETLRIALDALTRITGHEIVILHVLSADGNTLHLHGDRGLLPRLRALKRELRVGEGLIGHVAATGRTIRVADASQAPESLESTRAVVREEGIRGFVCVPIRSERRILGALSLGRRGDNPFSDADVTLLETAAGQVAMTLALSQG